MQFKKETHIELSDGDTYIVSNANCPLSEEEACNLGIVIGVNYDENIPCCKCNAYLNTGAVSVVCPHYYGYIYSKDKGNFFDCRINKQEQ